MKKFAVAVAGLAILSGCATTGSFSRMNTYRMPVQHVKMADDTYRVYDHKTENVVMVSPSMGKLSAAATVEGATFGLVDALTPQQRMEAAAMQHLRNTGRGNCHITRGSLLQKPLYEFWFECP